MGSMSIIVLIGAGLAAIMFLPKMLKGKADEIEAPPATSAYVPPSIAEVITATTTTPHVEVEPTLTQADWQGEQAALHALAESVAGQTVTPAQAGLAGYWISPHGE